MKSTLTSLGQAFLINFYKKSFYEQIYYIPVMKVQHDVTIFPQWISAHRNWRTGPFLLYNSIQMTFEGWINTYVRSKELEGL